MQNGTTYYVSFFPESTDGAINSNTANRTTGVPNRMTISSVPSQSGSLTYNGGQQYPTWSGYDSAKMTIGGATYATNAGTYHTGTTAANRTTYGYTQYRYIEGLWDNVYDWMDGCYSLAGLHCQMEVLTICGQIH